MTRTPQRLGSRETITDRVISILIDSTRRQYVLTVLAYITGILGLGLVFARELWMSVPDDIAVPASIVLMGISFLSLFVATLSGPAPGAR
jgi:hypothetical protein